MAAAHVTARAATVDDVQVIATLAADAAAEKAEQKGGDVWNRRERRRTHSRDALASMVASDAEELAVATLDGAVFGYAAVRVERLRDGPRLGVLDEIYVDPGARELGLGEALMEHVLEWCRRAGCFGIDSLALPGDRSTKNFFESFGLVARAIVVHRPLGS